MNIPDHEDRTRSSAREVTFVAPDYVRSVTRADGTVEIRALENRPERLTLAE